MAMRMRLFPLVVFALLFGNALLSFEGTAKNSPRKTAESAAERIQWNFENSLLGSVRAGAVVPRGSWEIRELPDAPAGPKVVVQTAHNRGATFNLLVFEQPLLTDLDLSVQLKALEGREDQGGGLVWRYQDEQNYYIARTNPLENNFRVYKVVKGGRLMLQSAPLVISPGWHTLRITMQGNQIECFLDGRSYLKVTDDNFSKAGRIGLWTKADAVTAFDDLRVSPPTNTSGGKTQ